MGRKKIDQMQGHPSMMTQYNLGWSLYKIGRFEVAIEAFNTGIPIQPDYAFVYFRRGLAYVKLGKEAQAKEDFSEFLILVGDQEVNIPAELKKEVLKLPDEYTAIKNL